MAALDLAAELGRHGHLAVADAEHRHAGVEDQLRRARRAGLVHRLRAAREDHALGLHLAEGGFGLLERDDLAIDALLADAAGDQLGHLTAEIDNQNLLMRRGHMGRRLAGLSVRLSWRANYATGRGLATLAATRHGRACPGHPRLSRRMRADHSGRPTAARNDGSCSLSQHRDEKPVRPGPARRHQPALLRPQRGLGKRLRLVPEHATPSLPAAAPKTPDGAR